MEVRRVGNWLLWLEDALVLFSRRRVLFRAVVSFQLLLLPPGLSPIAQPSLLHFLVEDDLCALASRRVIAGLKSNRPIAPVHFVLLAVMLLLVTDHLMYVRLTEW